MKSIIDRGIRFTACPNVVVLPTKDEEGNIMPYVTDGDNYVYFGQAVPKDKDHTEFKGAVKTSYNWNNEAEDEEKIPVYAVPIKLKGHSLTNMAYAENGYKYLAKGSKCYRAKTKRN